MKKILLAIIMVLLGTMLLAEPMPDFKLSDMNNKEVSLSDLLGKGPVLIDFWATWCVPCKKAMPALNELDEKYDSLTVVLISIDAPKDVSKAKSYLKSGGFKSLALFDSEKKLAKKLNVTNPPRTLILDKTGEVVMSHDGYETGTEKIYEAKIREMLSLPDEEEIIPVEKMEETSESKTDCPVEKTAVPCGGCK